jgi:hypothetical protein
VHGSFGALAHYLHHSFEGGNPYPEKFILVIAMDTKEPDAFAQRNGRVIRLLQYTGVKSEPTYVAGNIYRLGRHKKLLEILSSKLITQQNVFMLSY